MLVNGKVWPHLDVEPRLYRFRVLNGCNARIMSLDLGGAPMWQIGAEGGMWDRPVRMSRLVLTPGRTGRRDRRLPRPGGAHADRAQHDARRAGVDARPAAADGACRSGSARR